MSDIKALVWLACVVSVCGWCAGQLCKDIDPTACQLMASSRPDLCADPSLSQTACPRFCKLCPVECYNCNTTVNDYHSCNTTKLCNVGEVCMRKELMSFVDGHQEHEMTCAQKQACDGDGAVFHFGKRAVQQRDVSIHCCTKDRCNMPVDVAIVGCGKDIVFLIDRSIDTVQAGDPMGLATFLFRLVSKLTIGVNDSLVGVTEYDLHPHTQWELNRYTDRYDVLHAVQTLDLQKSPSHYQIANTDEAVQFIVDHALSPAVGDRPNHNDAVVIIASPDTAHRISVNVKHEQQLRNAAHDVIVVSVGPSSHELDGLSTDDKHLVHVNSYTDLTSTALPAVVNILNSCT